MQQNVSFINFPVMNISVINFLFPLKKKFIFLKKIPICVAYIPRCDANHSSASHPRRCATHITALCWLGRLICVASYITCDANNYLICVISTYDADRFLVICVEGFGVVPGSDANRRLTSDANCLFCTSDNSTPKTLQRSC